MDNFVVSARKYRPLTFDTVVGQSHVTDTLKNAIRTNQLAQAFLFCGPRGVGKTTCARILAKTINCTNPTADMEACGQCESCKDFESSASMNVIELDAASNNGVEYIRDLTEKVNFPPQFGKYRVYIIDEVHMLSTAAFNAFLKTLEEPPAHAKFILATTERHKIIPTILSRCQVFEFKRITNDDIVSHLVSIAQKEGVQYEEDALRLIAKHADGGLRDALSTFDQLVNFTRGNLSYELCTQTLNQLSYEYYFRLIEYCRTNNIPQALNLYHEVVDKGFDSFHFLTGLTEHIRNLMVALDPITHRLLEVNDEARTRFGEQAVTCGLPLLLKFLDIVSEHEYRYASAANKRLFVEICLMKMAGS